MPSQVGFRSSACLGWLGASLCMSQAGSQQRRNTCLSVCPSGDNISSRHMQSAAPFDTSLSCQPSACIDAAGLARRA